MDQIRKLGGALLEIRRPNFTFESTAAGFVFRFKNKFDLCVILLYQIEHNITNILVSTVGLL